MYNSKLNPETAKVGNGATVNLWSDREAYTIIKVTAKTITLQRDKVSLKDDYKPEWTDGGCPFCLNNGEQEWSYEPDENGEIVVAHWAPSKGYYMARKYLRVTEGRHEFYDYNF